MISLPVVEASQVGAARRRAVQQAEDLEFSDQDSDRLAIIVTEIATNLLRHAQEGEIVLIPSQSGGKATMTVLGLDLGSGIANVEAALADGYTTAEEGSERGIGGGLGAIRRLSDEFDIYSDPRGTTIIATVGPDGLPDGRDIEVAGLIVPKPGFDEGGDAFAVRRESDSTLVMLLDVLGHGSTAAEEARRGVEAFCAGSGESLDDAHMTLSEALGGGRGAAALIVKLPHGGDMLEAVGLGNVRGEIIHPDGQRRGIPCAPGIVGAATRAPRATEHEWPAGATLVLSTDGLRGSDRNPEPPHLFLRHPLSIAATLYKRRRRGSDDSGVLVARSPAA